MDSKTCIYLELSSRGVTSVKVVADSAEETAQAHAFLKQVAFEIRQLDAAAKEAIVVK